MLCRKFTAAGWGLLAWLLLAIATPAASFVKDDTVRCMRKGINGRANVSLTAQVTVRPNEGDTGVVIDGPQRHRGTDWWLVDWGGRRLGWTAESEPGRPSIRYLELIAIVRPPGGETPAVAGIGSVPASSAPTGPASAGTLATAASPSTFSAPGGSSDRSELQNLRSDVGAIVEILGSLDARIDQRVQAHGAHQPLPGSTSAPRSGSLAVWLAGLAVLVSATVLVLFLRQSSTASGSPGLIESRLAAVERRLASQAGPAIRQTVTPSSAPKVRVGSASEDASAAASASAASGNDSGKAGVSGSAVPASGKPAEPATVGSSPAGARNPSPGGSSPPAAGRAGS